MTTIEFPELPDQQYEPIVSLLLNTAHALNRRSMLDAADVRGFLAEMSIFPISSREVCEALTPAPTDIGKSLTPPPANALRETGAARKLHYRVAAPTRTIAS